MRSFNIERLLTVHILDNISSISITDALIALISALILGMFICIVYDKTYCGAVYSYNFGLTLIALTMISTMIVMVVTSNVLISIGMVGSLSIVRFRTAIKDSLDIMFVFWAIVTGIVIAAGMFILAIIGCIIIGASIYILSSKKSFTKGYLVIVRCTEKQEDKVISSLKSSVKKFALKSKVLNNDTIELQVEIRLKNDDTTFLNKIKQENKLDYISLISVTGEAIL